MQQALWRYSEDLVIVSMGEMLLHLAIADDGAIEVSFMTCGPVGNYERALRVIHYDYNRRQRHDVRYRGIRRTQDLHPGNWTSDIIHMGRFFRGAHGACARCEADE